MLATAALGGAVGSIASQGVAIALGMQDSFSWKGVAMSAIGAGAASGVGAIANAGMTAQQIATTPVAWSQAALRAGGASVATQGVGSLLGISSFSWKAVAASAAGAGASSALGSTGWMNGLNSVAAGTVRGLVSGGIQAGIFGTRPNWGSIAAQSFGQALGDSFTQGKVLAEAQRVGGSLTEAMQPNVPPVSSVDEKTAILAMFDDRHDAPPDGTGATPPVDPVMEGEDRVANQRTHALLRAQMGNAVYLADPSDPTKGYRGTLPPTVNGVVPGEGVLSAFAAERFENRETGFAARLFHDTERDTYTLAFRGTDDIRDFISGNRQAIDPDAPQYKQALDLVKDLRASLGEKLTDLTGHSLGAGLAAATSMLTGLPATTFNASGLNTGTVTGAGGTWSDERAQRLITNYRVNDEILTSLQERGSIGAVPLAISALAIGPAGLALQAMAAALPDAVGRQVTVDAIDAAGRPMSALERNNLFKMTPFDLHGMDYVLRGMSAYERQGTK